MCTDSFLWVAQGRIAFCRFFSPDFTLNGQVSMFCAGKWIFHKKLGTLLCPFASGNFAEKHILKLPSAIKLLEILCPKGPF